MPLNLKDVVQQVSADMGSGTPPPKQAPVNPATGGQFVPPPNRPPVAPRPKQALTPFGRGEIDMQKVVAGLDPSKVLPPTQWFPEQRTKIPFVAPQNRPAPGMRVPQSPQSFAPVNAPVQQQKPPTLEERGYEIGTPEASLPKGMSSSDVMWQGIKDEAKHTVTAAVDDLKEKVAASGKSNYVPLTGFGDIIHNIGQIPYLGVGATALVEGLDVGLQTLGTSGEASQKVLGQLYYTKYDPLKSRLGVQTPEQEDAFEAAMGVSYSGQETVKRAYNEALELAEAGQLTPENKQRLKAKHGIWWREAAGEAILDPLNIFDFVAAGGKAFKLAKQGSGAIDMFAKPLARNADDVIQTGSEVMAGWARQATRTGQAKQAETIVDKGLAFINPRNRESVIHRDSERITNFVGLLAGQSQKKAAALVDPNSARAAEEVVELSAQNFQEVASALAKTASDNPEDVTKAVEALDRLGIGSNVAESEMGRKSGIVLKQLMTTKSGELGDISKTLGLAVEEGLPLETVADRLYEKASKVIHDIIPETRWEKSAPLKLANTIVAKRRPIDSFLSGMYMGLNPGYAMRNMYDNLGRMVLNGYNPLKPVRDWEGKVGNIVVGAKRGIGQAEGTTSLPVAKAAEKIEQIASEKIASEAYADAIKKMWKIAVRDSGVQIPAEWQSFVRQFGSMDVGKLDELLANAEAGSRVTWAQLGELEDALEQAGPHLYENVLNRIYSAETPEDALVALKQLQTQFAEFMANNVEQGSVGPLGGTALGQLASLMGQDQAFSGLQKFAQNLSEIETNLQRSRNRAYSHAMGNAVGVQGEYLRYLEKIETDYTQAVQEILQRQTAEYAKLLAGDISIQQYKDAVELAYKKAYQQLDNRYSQVIGKFELPSVEGEAIASNRWVLEEAFRREAAEAGYFGAVNKSGSGAETVADTVGEHLLYGRDIDAVSNKHFTNKVRQVLARVGSDLDYKSVNDIKKLPDDVLLKVINEFRNQPHRKLKPLTMEELLDLHRPQMPLVNKGLPTAPIVQGGDVVQDVIEVGEDAVPAVMQSTATQTAKPVRMSAIPEKEMQQLIEMANNSKNPAVKNAVQALQTPITPGPSATGLDAIFHDGKKNFELINQVMEQIKRNVMNPPVVAGAMPEDLANTLRKLHTETHLVASEMARRARDFVLLDYTDRRMLDPILKVIYPWHYWSSRSVPNWLVSVASRPMAVSHYMKLKNKLREYNDNDPNVPEWAKDQIVINMPGYNGQLYWDYESAFNAVGSMVQGFDDPDLRKNAFGKAIQGMGAFGAAPHPLLMAAYAAELALVEGDPKGAQGYGYLSPQTRVFRSLTGKTLEPWLWLKDPDGNKIAWTGGSKWDEEKAVRKLAYNQSQGEYNPEEAILAAATRSGVPMENTMSKDIPIYRRLPVLASALGGLRISKKEDWERELSAGTEEYYRLKEIDPEAAAEYLANNQWISTAWLSWDDEPKRMTQLANNVLLGRFPPMPKADKNEILMGVGLTPELVQMFYDGKQNDSANPFEGWDERDYKQFSDGILDLAEILGVPDAQSAKEWRQARDEYGAVWEELNKKYPDNESIQETYFSLMESDPEAAKEYGRKSGYFDYLAEKNRMLLSSPLALKYYKQPEDIDSIANSLAYDELEWLYPGVSKEVEEYNSIPASAYTERMEYKRTHPNVNKFYQEFDEILEKTRKSLFFLRQYSQSSSGAPEPIDYIIKGQPNSYQKAVLDAIADIEQATAAEVPDPVKRPSGDPADDAYWKAKDAAWAEAVQAMPNLVDYERQYKLTLDMHGKDSANLYAKEVGLFDMRDKKLMIEMQHPEVVARWSDDVAGWAAKAMTRQESEKIWPGIQGKLTQYYNAPKGDARRKLVSDYPELRAYWDWKGHAETHYTNVINQMRGGIQNEVANINDARLQDIMVAIGQVESGNNYGAQNPKSSASGRYQYIDTTWANYGGYATAKDAPPEVQDTKMLSDLRAKLQQYEGSIEKVIAAHYYPKWADKPEMWNTPVLGDQPTIQEYINRVKEALNNG